MEFGFYRQGLWARGLVEISDDPEALHDGNFWAVVITYEGEKLFARFSEVRTGVADEFVQSVQGERWIPPRQEWMSSLNQSQYIEAVERVRESIATGDVYQINLCRVLSAQCENEQLAGLMPNLIAGNPAPFLTSLELPGLSIASASPELLLKREGEVITSSPIKGTAKDKDSFLEKDRAENVMIVDLVRHDFGSICQTGSVQTPRLLRVEEHPGLFHLVSDVQGNLKHNVRWKEIFAAILPAGSISGAPKSSAIELIKSLEKTKRGPYCGALGWVHGNRAEIAVAIRTFWIDHADSPRTVKFGTGAGITWGSDPLLEWQETELKARRLLSLISS